MKAVDHTIGHYTVRVQDTNPTSRIHLHRLMDYAQDSDDRNCGAFGLKSEELRKRNIAWILMAHAMRFTGEFPLAEETLIVDTWTRGTRGVRLFRDNRYYRGVVDDAHCFGMSSSVWIFASLAHHMPIRPNHVCDIEAYNRASDPQVGYLEKIPPLKTFGAHPEAVEILRYTARLGDLDVNDHFHNTHYSRLAVDAAGEYLAVNPLTTELMLRSFHIQFAKEVLYGESVAVYVLPDPAKENGLLVEGRMAETGEPSFFVTLEYTLRERERKQE